MVKSSMVKMCPKCNAVLNSPDSERCEQCGYRLKAAQTRFSPPNYIHNQIKTMDSKITGGEKNQAAQRMELQEDMIKYFTKCKEEDKVAILSDALNILRFAMISQDSTNTTRILTKHGKLIGKLALQIEEFSRSGGVLNVSEQLPSTQEPGDLNN